MFLFVCAHDDNTGSHQNRFIFVDSDVKQIHVLIHEVKRGEVIYNLNVLVWSLGAQIGM